MARDLLTVTALGNLGGDPTLRYASNGAAVCNFSIAVNHPKDDGTTWARVTAWGKLAELANNHLHKGDRVLVLGPGKLATWEGNDGQERVTLEITARDLSMVGGQGRAQAGQHRGSGGGARRPTMPTGRPLPLEVGGGQAPTGAGEPYAGGDPGDDLSW